MIHLNISKEDVSKFHNAGHSFGYLAMCGFIHEYKFTIENGALLVFKDEMCMAEFVMRFL